MTPATPPVDPVDFVMTLIFSTLVGYWCGLGPYRAGRRRVPVLPHLTLLVCVAIAVMGGVVAHLAAIGMEMTSTSLHIASVFGAFAVGLPVAGLLHLFVRLLAGPPAADDVVNLTAAPRGRR